jgi:hypothetical protein
VTYALTPQGFGFESLLHKTTFASSSLTPQGFASLSHKTTFASSLLCCAYHVERTTSSSRFVSL